MSSSRSSSSRSSSSDPSSSSSKSSSSSSKSAKPRTAAQIRQADYLEYITGLLKSHASYMGQPILSLSASVSSTPTEFSAVLALIYVFLHLVLPAFLLPHLSALVTLVIPLKNTLVSVAKEIKGKKNDDCAQWSWYWVVYGLLGLVRGGLGIWRPGWRGPIEIVRTGALICVGGPWFGNAGLKPPPPSEELVKQEKAEAAEQTKERDRAEREKTKADKKQAGQTKSDAKARERDSARERAQREKDPRRK